MTKADFLPVHIALQKVLDLFETLPAETVPLEEAAGRILAEDVIPKIASPHLIIQGWTAMP